MTTPASQPISTYRGSARRAGAEGMQTSNQSMKTLDHARGVYISCVPYARRVNQDSTGSIDDGDMHPSRSPVIRTSRWIRKIQYDGSHRPGGA